MYSVKRAFCSCELCGGITEGSRWNKKHDCSPWYFDRTSLRDRHNGLYDDSEIHVKNTRLLMMLSWKQDTHAQFCIFIFFFCILTLESAGMKVLPTSASDFHPERIPIWSRYVALCCMWMLLTKLPVRHPVAL